ncbi:hypothetical protein N7490_008412 [Penicillium lividum]|nr:hypothetical protein N7490_008412 [Penicillium lividum]
MSGHSTAPSSPLANSPGGEDIGRRWNRDDGLDTDPVHISSSPENDDQMKTTVTGLRMHSDATGDSEMMPGSSRRLVRNNGGNEDRGDFEVLITHQYTAGSANQETRRPYHTPTPGQRALPSHPAIDRKRRLTNTGNHDRLQRARSGDLARLGTQPNLPQRSLSMVGSSRGNSGSDDPGSSYATAIDITSSPPDAGSSVSHGNDDSLSITGSAIPRGSRQGPPAARMPPPVSAVMRPPRRHHSSSLRDVDLYHQYHQSGRAQGQPDATRNTRSERSLGVGWQASGTDERTLRAFFGGSTETQTLAEALRTADEGDIETTLPRWQPDAEVTDCPICGTVFSFWYRKHHCRKCGRVVCASCSPHRITIPRQYIVRPPESSQLPDLSPTPPRQIVDLTEEDPIQISAAINPALGGGEEVRLCNPCVPDPNPNPLGYGRTRGHRTSHSLPSSMGNRFSSQSVENSPIQGLRHESPEFLRVNPNRRQSRDERGDQYPLDLTSSRRRSATCEQDLCPICGRRFPDLNSEQTLETREAHIRQCIDNYGAPAAAQPASSARRGPAPPPLPPVSRMVEFTATEKDCIGEDGGSAECTICMVDYEGGDVLVRLECLCKFHKHCILDWFVHKMECPVHKVV